MESVQSEKKKEIPEKLEDDQNGNLMSSTVKETHYYKKWLLDQYTKVIGGFNFINQKKINDTMSHFRTFVTLPSLA